MALNYTTLVSEIATITSITSSVLVTGDNNFQGIMGVIIDYAEGRLYRDLDLLSATITDTSVSCTSGVRVVQLSTTGGNPLAIQTLNLFSSAGTTSSNATRISLVPASLAIIDTIYPSALSSNCGTPQYFARVTDTEVVMGPAPDQPYAVEMIATIRPDPLSASNSSTWLTQNVPELMVAACMVSAAGYMRDYGAQSGDPQMAQSWESQYRALMQTAAQDSQRMSFQSVAWTANSPTPLATPPRA